MSRNHFVHTTVLAGALVAASFAGSGPARAEDTTPPLPFHTIEGYGGGAITPMAYLVNAKPAQGVFGQPAFAISSR
ncbi:MAG TPA: hypothetical protein VHR86_10600, partial [Armatimonadota bacterium]|nr:hypothetical protein [Armatimonadota bacterium]